MHLRKSTVITAFAVMLFNISIAQVATKPLKADPKVKIEIKDPLKVRIHKLPNGLTLYLSVYKDAPRVQTLIATNAGSKNDPADATGLAHYLEHLLFKGTDKYGSADYSKEKPLLDQIENLYETYRSTTDEKKRKEIYHVIDSVSGVAAKYAIANEYDKMMSAIGAKGTNAFTSFEQTVYINDIPSNQLSNWMTVEAERFRNPVLRIFHTELEAVYEEKNISLDNDFRKEYEELFRQMFKKHQYGTQTTIGTIEHLKNPSIKKIKEYYNTYYVPNNMAIIMSGDFDPDAVIKEAEQKFGYMKTKAIPEFKFSPEDAITAPIEREVWGQDAENVAIAYRVPSATSPDFPLMQLLTRIMSNQTAGLIDLNLNQAQKVIEGYCYPYLLKDYGMVLLGANPKAGQKLEDVRALLIEQIEKLKKGEFEDWLVKASINSIKLDETKQFETNQGRAFEILNAFVNGMDWNHYLITKKRLDMLTKKDVIDFANKYFGNNYVVIYKRQGEDKNIQKVDKPTITPVEVNREMKSKFVEDVLAAKPAPLQPVFIDYSKDLTLMNLKNNVQVSYKMNTENNTFDLYYVYEMGTNNDKALGLAFSYLQYLGTSKYSPEKIKEEFYKLGCSFNVYSSNEQVYVTLSGLADSFTDALKLFEELLADPKENEDALTNLKEDIKKQRSDEKVNKDAILWDGMLNYAEYGVKSPFRNTLTNAELDNVKSSELIAKIKSLSGYEHHILYYGPKTTEALKADLEANHKTSATLKPVPPSEKFDFLDNTENKVLVVNYKDMQQAEILMVSKGALFNKDNNTSLKVFNEYFGGGMSSVVFQTLRESKALAYSTFATFSQPYKAGRPYYISAYIGTQADKLPESMGGMFELLNDMPQSELNFNAAKEAIIQKTRSERITRSSVLMNYEAAKRLGYTEDPRKKVFEMLGTYSLNDLNNFYGQNIKNKKYTICILGDESKLDMKTLEKYGKISKLSIDELFNY